MKYMNSVQNNQIKWQCILICWGDKYSVELINHLICQIKKFSSSVGRFVLICDEQKIGLNSDVLVRGFPDFYLQPNMKRIGCQAKLAMFEVGIIPDDLPAVYVDLDTVILGDLSVGLRFMDNESSIAILPTAIIPIGPLGRWLYRVTEKRRYARGNSSVVVFHPAHCTYIAERFRELFVKYPSLEFRPMAADERFISWVAQPHVRALPSSFVVKFPGEFMSRFKPWLYIKARLPWVVARREGLVAITLNGLLAKPEHLIKLNDGAVVTDNKSRHLIWSRATLGSSLDKILDFYRFLF